MIEKLNEIINSYYVGQKEQMVEQIKSYGQAKFFLDLYDNRDYVEEVFDFSALYTKIVYIFFLLK